MKRTVIRRGLAAGLVSLGVLIVMVCSAIPARAQTPSISSISPNSAVAGGGNFTLTVNGSNFASGAVVRWNGSNRTTSGSGATQRTAAILASDIAAAGT